MKTIFVTLSFCLLFFQAQAIRLGYKFSHLKPQTSVGEFWSPSNGLGVRCQLNDESHSVAVGFEVDYYVMKSYGYETYVDMDFLADDFFDNNWYYDRELFKNSYDLYNSLFINVKFLDKKLTPYLLQKVFVVLSNQEYTGIDENSSWWGGTSSTTVNTTEESAVTLGFGITTEMGVSYDLKKVNFAAGIAKTYGLHTVYRGFSQLQYNFIFSFILAD